MLPEKRIATHPGEILKEEFLDPAGISQVNFARLIGVPLQRVNEIIRGKRGITPETAWLFSEALGATPQFWMNLQNAYDLTKNRPDRKVERLGMAANEQLTSPSMTNFNGLTKEARKQAKAAGLKKSDIARAVAKSREQK